MEMPNLTLHPAWLSFMPAYQHAVGVGTHAFSALAFYLMIKKTPQPGKPFALYLIALQLSITLVDLNFGFLATPTALYPIPGFLCNGVLCTVFGVNGHYGITLMFFTVAFVAVTVLCCFHFKFVTILTMARQRKISIKYRILFRVVLFVISCIPGIGHITLRRNIDGGPEFIAKYYPNLNYLFENPNYRTHVYDLTLYPANTIFVASVTLMTLVPLTIQLSPLLVYAYSMITWALTPDINNAIFCFQMTHAFVHTAIVIMTTPSYLEALTCRNLRKVDPIASATSQVTRQPGNP